MNLISPFHKREGELLLYEKHCYFIDSNAYSTTKTNFENLLSLTRHRHKIKWSYEEIREVHKRRYLLQNNGMEFFFINGQTSLISFQSKEERDKVYDKILSFDLPNRIDYEREVTGTFIRLSITEKWQKGLISNFEYLMHINTIAGRSFNDLTQYPVFPYVISNYHADSIDLNDENNYRDLSKPMGALNPDRLMKFEERYKSLVEMGDTPFFYGTHYSNMGSVLHFLIRLAPFSYYFIEFQGGNFDVPDRSFHNIYQSWRLSSFISPADVKELIPSFYCLPEFLVNINHYDMGAKQEGTQVSDVKLAPWAKDNPRLFIKILRQALESKYVSENLNNWIDLIFGYKQIGEMAIKSKNLFHPYTYEGAINTDEIEDKLQRDAAITMINNYGQTPKQIFKKPHPKRTHPSIPSTIFNSYDRLSPTAISNIGTEIGYISHRYSDGSPLILPAKRVPFYPELSKYISWGHWDRNLRICAMDSGKVYAVVDCIHNDDINCAAITRNGRSLLTGGTSGCVKIWKKLRDRRSKTVQLKLYTVLHGHSDQVTCVTVSQEWSIFVTGSKDRSCIAWDLNRCNFIYSIDNLPGPVRCVSVSPNTVLFSTLFSLVFLFYILLIIAYLMLFVIREILPSLRMMMIKDAHYTFILSMVHNCMFPNAQKN